MAQDEFAREMFLAGFELSKDDLERIGELARKGGVSVYDATRMLRLGFGSLPSADEVERRMRRALRERSHKDGGGK